MSDQPRDLDEHQHVIRVMNQEWQDLQSQMSEMESQFNKLGAEEGQVDQDAAQLEAEILDLAQAQKHLRERKQKIETQARGIGECRTELLHQREQLNRQKESLQTQIVDVVKRKQQAEQKLVSDAEQRAAEFQSTPAGSTASPAPVPIPSPDLKTQRSFPRLSMSVEVSLHTESNFYTGLTENISEGGLFIATRNNLAIGTHMDLTIFLPDLDPLQISGEVCWIREYNQFTEDQPCGVGVSFHNISEQHSQIIADFIRSRSPLLYEEM